MTTLHLKGRFSKINEPEVPLAWGCSGPVWALFFTYWKIEQPAFFEGWWYTGKKSTKSGQNGHLKKGWLLDFPICK